MSHETVQAHYSDKKRCLVNGLRTSSSQNLFISSLFGYHSLYLVVSRRLIFVYHVPYSQRL